MLILTVVFILCLVLASVLRGRQTLTKKAVLNEKVRINALLHNIEVYDGTPKGQKRLEDIK